MTIQDTLATQVSSILKTRIAAEPGLPGPGLDAEIEYMQSIISTVEEGRKELEQHMTYEIVNAFALGLAFANGIDHDIVKAHDIDIDVNIDNAADHLRTDVFNRLNKFF